MHSFYNYEGFSSMGGQLCVKKHDWAETAGVNNDDSHMALLM